MIDIQDFKEPKRIVDGMELRWKWPDGCTAVDVGLRVGGPPACPGDPEAVWTPYTLSEYQNNGGRWLIPLDEKSKHHYGVMICAKHGSSERAPCDPSACVKTFDWIPWTRVSYRFDPDGKKDRLLLSLEVRSEQSTQVSGGIKFLMNETNVPSPNDPVAICPPWIPPKPGNIKTGDPIRIYLKKITQENWARFYLKAFPVDLAERESVLMLHPDTCDAFLPSGERLSVRSRKPEKRYRPGIPMEIVCPYCLNEFSISEMMFAPNFHSDKSKAQHAKFTWLRRFVGKAPKPPRGAQGQRFTRRICPEKDCGKDLPASSGSQPSLVIGLIGEKYSSKSHYITALIHRLHEIKDKLDMNLVLQDQETRTRYQNMDNLLFGKKTQIRVTSGTPPPLVYDLKMNGRLWRQPNDRTSTLAFYETAGENLQSFIRIEEMVKYLKVAAGIIFLIDPLQIPAIRDLLPNVKKDGDGNGDTVEQVSDPDSLIQTVIAALQNNGIIEENGGFAVPMAIALAKCDELAAGGIIPKNRIWNSDRSHHLGLNTVDTEDISGMIGEIMQQYCPGVYNTVKERFPIHSFFGVSATGCSPDNFGIFPFVKPHRVEDPLLWLLHQLELFPENRLF